MLTRISKLVLLALLVGTLTSCAQFHEWFNQPNDQTYSSEEGAQQKEVTYEQATYKKADRPPPSRPRLRKECIEHNGQKTCGYDCKQSGGEVKCASSSEQRCVVAPSGQVLCGYDCVTTTHSAKCGKYLYDNCVADMSGNIRCGNNCYVREDDGQVVCGK